MRSVVIPGTQNAILAGFDAWGFLLSELALAGN
jgi:hypothetical protein